ncbi:MAG: phasin family protein [Gammaproteobacteria bacterium]|nr:MAG: phasin family protein [Gammaproteobacteria bacterium]
MYEQLLAQLTEQSQKFAEPVSEITSLTVDYIEKLSQFQVNAVKSYTDLGMDQLKNAADIKDAESLQAFIKKQTEVASSVSKKIAEDAQTLAKMGEVFANDVQALAQKDLARLSEMTAPFLTAAQG